MFNGSQRMARKPLKRKRLKSGRFFGRLRTALGACPLADTSSLFSITYRIDHLSKRRWSLHTARTLQQNVLIADSVWMGVVWSENSIPAFLGHFGDRMEAV